MKLAKKTKRLLAYVGILGGCAILAMTFFTISQFEKAKYQASVNTQLLCTNQLEKLKAADSTLYDKETETYNSNSAYYKYAIWWDQTLSDFNDIVKQNSNAYVGTAVPAYLFSMTTLVAFGLVLKHAEKAKEKEDEEAVLKPGGN